MVPRLWLAAPVSACLGGCAAGPPAPEPASSAALAPSGRTAAETDATTAAERSAARETRRAAERALGTTVASLGDSSQQGLWLRTPLVSSRGRGRVEVAGGERSALVELIPAEGGSRLSLAAMRRLEVPLTALPEIAVYLR